MEIDVVYDLCKPRSWDMAPHMDVLSRLATDRRVVELGCRSGDGSTIAFLKGRPIWLESWDLVACSNYDTIKQAADKAKILWTFHLEDDLKAEISECDLLFIDTLHLPKQFRAELEIAGAKASTFIGMHDLWSDTENEINDAPGMVQVLGEFLAKGGWMLWYHSGESQGLTILVRTEEYRRTRGKPWRV